MKRPKKEMKPHGMEVLLDSRQVCNVLNITAPTLSRMVHGGTIPHILLTTGKRKWVVRFRRQELEAWLTRRSRGPVPRINGEVEPPKSTHLLDGLNASFQS
jgi:excisionase family DNA binding protein